MGVVHRALDERLGREVALKILWPHLAGEPSLIERFEREARAAARARHPNVVEVFDVGEAEGHRYLAMEYVRGTSLRARLDAGPIPRDESLRITREILEGLAAAHDSGLIHRDIKPGNILLSGDKGTVKIADFGLARVAEEATALTKAGEILGTPVYLAPEISRGEEATRRSDLYAMGVILYRLLTGRLPYEGINPAALLEAHQRGRYSPPSHLIPDLAKQADPILSRLLARDPQDRYPTCRAALEDLARWSRGEEVLPGLPRAYEAIDEGLSRRPLPLPRALWNRIDAWVRFQTLEVFGHTEKTAVILMDVVRTLDDDLRDAHKRLEESVLLRERLVHEIKSLRRGSTASAVAAETALMQGDEAAARDALEGRVASIKPLSELQEELCKTEALVVELQKDYTRRASEVANARHRSDLLFSRRRRAKIELSLLGVLHEPQRKWGASAIAFMKIALLGLLMGGAFVVGSAATAYLGVESDRHIPRSLAEELADPAFAKYLADIPPGIRCVHVRSNAAPGGDGSRDRPFSSIAEGVAAANDNWVVLVHPGEYTGGAVVERQVTIVGAGPERTAVDPISENKAIFSLHSDARIRGFLIRNKPMYASSIGVAIETGAIRPEIAGCVIRNQWVAIQTTASAPLVRANVLYANFFAMTIGSATHPTFVNNIVYRNTFSVATDRFTLAPIESPEAGPNPVVVRANVVYGNNSDFGFFHIYGARNIEVAPGLRAPADGNFRLRPGSPAIDVGETTYALGSYFGSAPDAGTYEFDPSEGASWAAADSIPGRLIYEAEESIHFLRDEAGNMTLRPLSLTAAGENPERFIQFMNLPASQQVSASVLAETTTPLEILVAVGSPSGPWKGFAALTIGCTVWRANPGDEGRDNSVYNVLLERPTLFANALVLTAQSGPEIRLVPQRVIRLAATSSATEGIIPRLIASRIFAGTSGVLFSPLDNLATLVAKMQGGVARAVLFAEGDTPRAANASMTFHAATLATEDFDRRVRLDVGDFVYEIEITRFRYSMALIQNPELLGAIPERRPYSQQNLIPYLHYVSLRVRCFHRE